MKGEYKRFKRHALLNADVNVQVVDTLIDGVKQKRSVGGGNYRGH